MALLETLFQVVLCWYGYVFAMHVREKWAQLHALPRALAVPPVLYAYLVDVVLNIVVLTVVSLELPREATVSKRLHRWQTHPHAARYPRRARAAAWFCMNMLNPFDPDHC